MKKIIKFLLICLVLLFPISLRAGQMHDVVTYWGYTEEQVTVGWDTENTGAEYYKIKMFHKEQQVEHARGRVDHPGNTATLVFPRSGHYIVMVTSCRTTADPNVDECAQDCNPNFSQISEGEDMANTGSGGPSGDFNVQYGNGSIYKSIDLPFDDQYRFEVIAKADLYDNIGPELELYIDGQLKGTHFVNNMVVESFAFFVEMSAGSHEIALNFNNDAYNPETGMDRNLHLDKIIVTSLLETCEDAWTKSTDPVVSTVNGQPKGWWVYRHISPPEF